MKLTLVHLYPKLLNIYGDYGNIIALKYRAEKRGIKLTVRPVEVGEPLKNGSFELLFAGGGQDQQQVTASRDLQKKKMVLRAASDAGVPMLTICGSFQLFGDFFKPFAGPKLKGVGLLPAYTVADKVRKIGNLVIKLNPSLRSTIDNLKSDLLVGFENHSGNTWLKDKSSALGKVVIGHGNNGKDHTEGCRINNVFGCYLHGSLLPKNPHFADHLIKLALTNKYGPVKLKPLNDRLEWQAHRQAVARAKKLAHPLLKYI
ncbi:MAG: CobB/CobQ domain protein glutamine amidotransferase [Candidatus Beckwithbacteria bacterium GW2011_GWB1_47_15]|uniref:Lipid II isoglutaminyl synthase (glutamine-hydrolyzing) subunit GatD n=1 Tax=Candidatus Beckwithbacteria bacterium GW2011_GWB1_47_15 TaxID=1618371 RepID=A0A0G1RW27_9BACT|nr:MAG: CobB/CobQ domain-containing protein glutamine amidotransferase [Candidatus Beckwithbacteria bacterium GW2011_GWC1_49_16]KKU34944.1 MAG: CobB/CobQ domain protein glutamine amidotransferase [Candidatus Beckwithbacteria bacterium GW2011_GWA1_46_30]KKU61347.1 MAG: CobB/CobQ domain protein glutamine amidotransferase [Candidatus Beckwithbacteria bacterium GW2011_GWB1_47_15]KKU71382.1 MAG: CobB/CobQ domain protein glutamine amidotransferase [Candidatus Beckwithbacteria bacterium GW2011_GWA2_47_